MDTMDSADCSFQSQEDVDCMGGLVNSCSLAAPGVHLSAVSLSAFNVSRRCSARGLGLLSFSSACLTCLLVDKRSHANK
jgi:hypothetical protein